MSARPPKHSTFRGRGSTMLLEFTSILLGYTSEGARVTKNLGSGVFRGAHLVALNSHKWVCAGLFLHFCKEKEFPATSWGSATNARSSAAVERADRSNTVVDHVRVPRFYFVGRSAFSLYSTHTNMAAAENASIRWHENRHTHKS